MYVEDLKEAMRKLPNCLVQLYGQRDALLKKNPELKALEEVDIPSFLRDRERRFRKVYNRRRKAI